MHDTHPFSGAAEPPAPCYIRIMPGVLAYHLVLTAYGFWLPNDPRGSWSNFVRSIELYRAAGPATKTDTRRSVAHRAHDHDARKRAKQALKYSPVQFTGEQARVVMQGIADRVGHAELTVYAAAVMTDHVHLVIGRSAKPIERVADQIKSRATHHLNQAGLHPMPETNGRRPSPWARNSWQVYLNNPDDIQRAVRYVEQNPIKAGLKPQRYPWVTTYPTA